LGENWWRRNQWFLVRGGSHIVYEIWPHGGRLYAGNGEVWSFDGAWRKEPERYSADSPTVEAFTSYQGRLIAATAKNIFPSQHLPVWALTDSWAPVVSTEYLLEYSLSAANNINALITYGGRLLAGVGGTPGTAGVWELGEGGLWAQVAGNGVDGSWGSLGDQFQRSNGHVYRMYEFQGDLYIGMGSEIGMGQVWRFRPQQ
jgi:hypothetical protein